MYQLFHLCPELYCRLLVLSKQSSRVLQRVVKQKSEVLKSQITQAYPWLKYKRSYTRAQDLPFHQLKVDRIMVMELCPTPTLVDKCVTLSYSFRNHLKNEQVCSFKFDF